MNAKSTMKRAILRAVHHCQGPLAMRALGNRWAVSSIGRVPSFRRRIHPTYTILVYHRVTAEQDPFTTAPVSPEQFEQQMAYLKGAFTVVSLEELARRARGGTLEHDMLGITFDDGYADNYEVAFPILRKYNFPATIFLIAESMETGIPPWFEVVLQAFRRTTKHQLDLTPHHSPVAWRSLEERAAVGHALLRMLREIPDATRQLLVPEIVRQLAPDRPRPEVRMLNWTQVREMHSAGISFGSHTVTHPILSRCARDQVRMELVESKAILEKGLEADVSTLAYPSGRVQDVGATARELAREAGYELAVTVSPGANDIDSDPWLLRREMPAGPDLSQFSWWLSYSSFQTAAAL